jgi:hypothetical protein
MLRQEFSQIICEKDGAQEGGGSVRGSIKAAVVRGCWRSKHGGESERACYNQNRWWFNILCLSLWRVVIAAAVFSLLEIIIVLGIYYIISSGYVLLYYIALLG